ncbi:portal protein [Magnetovibrio sp. PR-2]|uniref:portal protein n=1 Tax=Magnetovibrio sp. PR-2 TaxID=3120356 RepID=UPI002FCE1C83
MTLPRTATQPDRPYDRTEVLNRSEEMAHRMDPTYERLQSGFLSPLIERTYAILLSTYTICPLEWVEVKDDLFESETCGVHYQVWDNQTFPPTGPNGARYLTPPAPGWCASGNEIECTLHETQAQAMAVCEADWHKRILPALKTTGTRPESVETR